MTDSASSEGSGERRRTESTSSGKFRDRALSFVPKRVVVMAVDDSDNAKYAFNWFLENIHRQDDLLILVHCPEPAKLPTISFKSPITPPIDEWKKILDDMNHKTKKLEEEYAGICVATKLRYQIRGESIKNPGEGILKVAEEENADLICIGSRGLGAFKRAVLGSVSDYVVKNSTIPVVVVNNRHK